MNHYCTSLSLSASVKHFGSPKFEKALKGEIEAQSSCLPIEDLCRYGGWPKGDPQIGTIRWQVKRGALHVGVAVFFDELVPSSCADWPFPEPVSGELELIVDLDTGKVIVRQDDFF